MTLRPNLQDRNYSKRRTTLQERPRVTSPSEVAGLSSDAQGCGCGDCYQGTPSEDCPGCCRVHKRRHIYPSELYGMDGTKWAEGSKARKTTKAPGLCEYNTASFNGQPCTVAGESAHNVYLWKTYKLTDSEHPHASRYLGKWITELVLVADNGCPIVEVIFCKSNACQTEAADCQCPWTFRRGIFNNIQPPRQCSLCVTPLNKTPPTICGNDCTVPFPTDMVFTFSDDGDDEVVSGMNGAEVLMTAATLDSGLPVCLGDIGGLSGSIPTTMAYDVDSAPEGFGDLEGDPEQPSSLRAGWHLEGFGVGTLHAASVAGGAPIAGWISDTIPLCTTPVTFPIVLTGSTPGWPTTITVTKGKRIPATSSDGCGVVEEACEDNPCQVKVVEVSGAKYFQFLSGENCGDLCGCDLPAYMYCTTNGLAPFIPSLGNASDYEVDDVLDVPCVEGGSVTPGCSSAGTLSASGDAGSFALTSVTTNVWSGTGTASCGEAGVLTVTIILTCEPGTGCYSANYIIGEDFTGSVLVVGQDSSDPLDLNLFIPATAGCGGLSINIVE